MRQPKDGAGDKLKEQQQGNRTLHRSCGGVVGVAQAEPTMQRCDLGKECAKARRYRALHPARTRIYEIHVAVRGLYFHRQIRVLMYGQRVHGSGE